MMSYSVGSIAVLCLLSLHLAGSVPAEVERINGTNTRTTGPDGEKRFLLFPHKVSWISAHKHCTSEGKKLASIMNLNEQIALDKAVKEQLSMIGKEPQPMWIGATDQVVEGMFRWIGEDDFAKISYDNWDLGQPNNYLGQEHCTETNPALENKWNDVNCDNENWYICQYYGQPETLFDDSVCFNGTNKSTGPNCQKQFYFYKQKVSFWDAFINCQAEGKKLASILNRYDQNALQKAMMEQDVDQPMWIGATDRWVEGTFQWIGEKSAEIRYTNWASGQPSNYLGQEHCTVTDPALNYMWNDINCDEKRGYICEDNDAPDTNRIAELEKYFVSD